MKVLLVAGLPGSGKSTITKFVANKQGFPVVETGEMVYEEAKNMGLQESENKIGFLFYGACL
jgi:cytidylate kinase